MVRNRCRRPRAQIIDPAIRRQLCGFELRGQIGQPGLHLGHRRFHVRIIGVDGRNRGDRRVANRMSGATDDVK
jgi:hypothetical protein